MALVVVFRYKDCGWEAVYPMPRERTKTTVEKWLGRTVSRRHYRECEVCRENRKATFTATRRTLPEQVKSTPPD